MMNLELFEGIGFKKIMPSTFFMGGEPHLYEDWWDDIMGCSLLFEASFTKEYWISTQRFSYEHFSLLGITHDDISYWHHEYGIRASWLTAYTIAERINEIYADKLPKGYFVSLPTEVHWEYALRNNLFIDSMSSEPDYLERREWVFDPLACFPKGSFVDWHGGITENEPDLESNGGKLRVSRSCNSLFPEMRIGAAYSNTLFFRLSIRPKTMYDTNDLLIRNVT